MAISSLGDIDDKLSCQLLWDGWPRAASKSLSRSPLVPLSFPAPSKAMSDAHAHAAAEAQLETTLGALEIGVLIALFFFGTVTAQSSLYYKRFPKDRWNIKALVRGAC